MRSPDWVIGDKDDPYLLRWWVIPRNKLFNIYLHHILKSDDDEALHDHPWYNISILLKGGYKEVTPKGEKTRRRWSIVFRKATALHRLEIYRDDCWSLFITGPVLRIWGFQCPKGWIPWKEFVNNNGNNSLKGHGCGETDVQHSPT